MLRTHMKKKTLLISLFAAVLLGACGVNIPKAPTLELELPVSGSEEVWDASAHQGSPVLVAFMASYCGWCKRSLPALETANAEFKDKGVEVIGVYVDEDEDVIEKIKKDYGLKSVILYRGGEAAGNMGVQGFPHIMLFDKNHNLVKIWSGYSDSLADEYREHLNSLTK